jgi:hypothetical protein
MSLGGRCRVGIPATVVRRNGQERQLVHALDTSQSSARIGGLSSPLEAGEIIELQLGSNQARFQVVWMGASGSAMASQAGLRSLEPAKNIWNGHFHPHDPNEALDAGEGKDASAKPSPVLGERRWHRRYTCSGGVSVKTSGSRFAVYGEVKDISNGGLTRRQARLCR